MLSKKILKEKRKYKNWSSLLFPSKSQVLLLWYETQSQVLAWDFCLSPHLTQICFPAQINHITGVDFSFFSLRSFTILNVLIWYQSSPKTQNVSKLKDLRLLLSQTFVTIILFYVSKMSFFFHFLSNNAAFRQCKVFDKTNPYHRLRWVYQVVKFLGVFVRI